TCKHIIAYVMVYNLTHSPQPQPAPAPAAPGWQVPTRAELDKREAELSRMVSDIRRTYGSINSRRHQGAEKATVTA
ncbi:MAG: hypothetical protein GY943_06105, partial [Chloroflexi bacterium]|nr:hypothetical protein [Chloroflexota bacterium]